MRNCHLCPYCHIHSPPEMIIQQFSLYHMAVFIVWKGAMYQLTFSGIVYTVHKTCVLKRQLVLIHKLAITEFVVFIPALTT